MGTVLRQMLCITKMPNESLRLPNWIDVYVQNQMVFLIIIFCIWHSDTATNTTLLLSREKA